MKPLILALALALPQQDTVAVVSFQPPEITVLGDTTIVDVRVTAEMPDSATLAALAAQAVADAMATCDCAKTTGDRIWDSAPWALGIGVLAWGVYEFRQYRKRWEPDNTDVDVDVDVDSDHHHPPHKRKWPPHE